MCVKTYVPKKRRNNGGKENPEERNIFEIPEKTLNQLDEFSLGGFLLFTFDEYGNPRINSNFDTMTHATAMQAYVQNWVRALDNLNLKLMMNSIENHNKNDGGLEDID